MIRMQRKPALAVSVVLTSAVTVLVAVLGAGAGFFGFGEGHAQPEAATQQIVQPQPEWPAVPPATQYVTDYEYYDDRAHNGAQDQPEQPDAANASVEAPPPESDVPVAEAPADDAGGTVEIHDDGTYEYHDDNQPEPTDVPEPQGTPEPHDPPEPTDSAH